MVIELHCLNLTGNLLRGELYSSTNEHQNPTEPNQTCPLVFEFIGTIRSTDNMIFDRSVVGYAGRESHDRHKRNNIHCYYFAKHDSTHIKHISDSFCNYQCFEYFFLFSLFVRIGY